MLLGSLSIAGFPFFSGFWSKDLVIEAAFEAGDHNILFMVMWVLAIITAFMTAFYMFRMWFMTFMGEPRENAQHCHGESPKTMTTPLIILAVFALISGLFCSSDSIRCSPLRARRSTDPSTHSSCSPTRSPT
jgi:NADH-quinone oxidoreductase subunit L